MMIFVNNVHELRNTDNGKANALVKSVRTFDGQYVSFRIFNEKYHILS